MYEKHIDEFTAAQRMNPASEWTKLLGDAIDLMRAVEKAEWQICTTVAASISSTAPVFVDAIASIRAAARAEGYVQGREDQSKVPCIQHSDALAAARVEIERLRADIGNDDYVAGVERKLQILENENYQLKRWTDAQGTQLTNLRTAAERLADSCLLGRGVRDLRDAIEASR